jgi:hypothetical protein
MSNGSLLIHILQTLSRAFIHDYNLFLLERQSFIKLTPYFARFGSMPIDSKQTIAQPCSANCLFFSL